MASLQRLFPLIFLIFTAACHVGVKASSKNERWDSNSELSRHSRVVIVGAGPAGIHMAYLLRRLGFSNLLVLEASNRVGGRSLTLSGQDGLVHEMGTCYLSSDYADFRRMASAIHHRLEEAILPEATMRLTDASGAPYLESMSEFVFDRVRRLDPKLTPDSTNSKVISRIYQSEQRYVQLRQEILHLTGEEPDYLEFPLTQPPAEDMARLNCTLLEFLRENDLLPLEPYILVGMTAMGYGSPGDTSALYGLMWMTPAYLDDLLGARENSRLAMLQKGFQAFWEAARDRLQRVEGVQFRLNSRVEAVARHQGGGVTLRVAAANSDVTTQTFDWLVWTPSMRKALLSRTFVDLTPQERDIFSRLKARQFRTRLVRLTPGSAPVAMHPVGYYLSQLDSNSSPSLNHLLAVRNSKLALNYPLDKTAASLLEQESSSTTVVAYYLSGYCDDNAEHCNLWRSRSTHVASSDHPDAKDIEAGETLADVTFDYMPRFSVPDMAGGILWRLLDRVQGARRTWFAGHSVVFESVKSVMKYNKMLLLTTFPQLRDRLKEL